MTEKQIQLLRKKFPNAPESFFKRQEQDAVERQIKKIALENTLKSCANLVMETKVEFVPSKIHAISITITGQIMGGKNNMIVTRSGLHFPKKSWATWRDAKVAEVKSQLPTGWIPISVPINARLDYVAGDKRRRDQSAIVDSIFHVLEKAGVVTDDTFIWFSQSTRIHDKANPHATITFLP